jgi:hypothetical protein
MLPTPQVPHGFAAPNLNAAINQLEIMLKAFIQ